MADQDAMTPPAAHMQVEQPPALDDEDLKILEEVNIAVNAEMAVDDPDLDARIDAMTDIVGGLAVDSAHAAAALATPDEAATPDASAERAVSVWRCQAGHYHVKAAGREESFAPDDTPVWLKEICRDEQGRFAPCGSGGQTSAVREAQKKNRYEKTRKLIEKLKGKKPTHGEILKLHEHLTSLTAAQLKTLRDEHGLKASAAIKDTLKDKIKTGLLEKLANEQPAAKPAATPSAQPAATPIPVPVHATPPTPPAQPAATADDAGRPKPFASGTAAHQWGVNNFDAWQKGLTADQKKAVNRYKGSSYHDINKDLRAGVAPDKVENYAETIKHLDAALAKGRFTKDVIAYRGTSSATVTKMLQDAVGGHFHDKGYMSTSLSHKEAEDGFSSRYGGAMIEIHIPKGTRTAYVDAMPNSLDHEREVLIPRGSKLHILSAAKDADGRLQVKARLVK